MFRPAGYTAPAPFSAPLPLSSSKKKAWNSAAQGIEAVNGALMKLVFLGVFVGLLLLSLVAWLIQPQVELQGRLPLVWASDPNPARREQVALFNRLYPQYELRLDPNNNGMEKVIVQSLAGVGPDLFDCYSGSQLSAFVKSGIAWDVTGELPALGIDYKREVFAPIHPTFVLDGRAYGLTSNFAVAALWFNKDIFDACGVPYPAGNWTWEDFIPLAKRMTVRDENNRVRQFGLLCGWGNFRQFILQYGGAIYSEDGTRCIVDSPEASAGVQMLHDLIYKHRVMPSPVEEAGMATQGGYGSGLITLFGGGKAAMALGGRYWLCALRGQKLRLGVVEGPWGVQRVYLGDGHSTLINKYSPNRRAALDFFRYKFGKEYNELINHQADGVAPVARYCQTPEFLHDPAYPEEDYNAVWRDIIQYAVCEELSPFVNGRVATRLLEGELDLVRNDQKTPAEALRAAAQEINLEIQKTVQRDPDLRARYAQLTKGKQR